jgi:hypothetical protein
VFPKDEWLASREPFLCPATLGFDIAKPNDTSAAVAQVEGATSRATSLLRMAAIHEKTFSSASSALLVAAPAGKVYLSIDAGGDWCVCQLWPDSDSPASRL